MVEAVKYAGAKGTVAEDLEELLARGKVGEELKGGWVSTFAPEEAIPGGWMEERGR